MAKLNPDTGVLDSQFAPVTTYQISVPVSPPVTFNALIVAGNSVYAGGEAVGLADGTMMKGITKLDATTGLPDGTFAKNAALYANDLFSNVPAVYALALAGSSLYVAGDFTCPLDNGTGSAINLAKIDALTGAVDPAFTQNGGPDSAVLSLDLTPETLFISGDFTSYRDGDAGYSIPLDPSTGANQTP
jgi:hypothetical protein